MKKKLWTKVIISIFLALSALIFLGSTSRVAAAPVIQGRFFIDSNQNGRKEASEPILSVRTSDAGISIKQRKAGSVTWYDVGTSRYYGNDFCCQNSYCSSSSQCDGFGLYQGAYTSNGMDKNVQYELKFISTGDYSFTYSFTGGYFPNVWQGMSCSQCDYPAVEKDLQTTTPTKEYTRTVTAPGTDWGKDDLWMGIKIITATPTPTPTLTPTPTPCSKPSNLIWSNLPWTWTTPQFNSPTTEMPPGTYLISSGNHSFSWQSIGANKYYVSIMLNGVYVVNQVETTATSYTYNFSQVGKYTLYVIAQNACGYSGWLQMGYLEILPPGTTPTPTPTPVCTDSDGGWNLGVKGTCSGPNLTASDYCGGQNSIQEFWCTLTYPSVTEMCLGFWTTCPSGTGCVDGACVTPPPVTKTMCAKSSDSGGGVVSAASITKPDTALARSQRLWVATPYSGVDFPDYNELRDMYTVNEVVTSYASINNSKVYQWDCTGPGPCTIDFSPCGWVIKAVVFVNGDLSINTNFAAALSNPSVPQLLTARNNCASSLAFIVKGDITIAPTVNNIYGIFYAGGTINTGSSSNRLYVFGNLLAKDFGLGRNLQVDNTNYPAEQIISMPKYFLDLGSENLLGQTRITWREIK